jgi:5-carboxymethyl-2-hydroxymuconate isomerase
MKRVFLHIDSLVLKGFRHEDRQGIAEGLQQELTRLFADAQATRQLTASVDIRRLRIGSIQVDQNSNSQQVGSQLAQGIGKGIKR